MNDKPYGNQKKKDLILRDWLAGDRTVLANERTYLSYIRTALAVFIVGAGLIYYFKSGLFWNLGIILLPAALIIFIIGTYRYIQTRKSLNKLMENKPEYDDNLIRK